MKFFASVALGAQVALAGHYFDGVGRVHLRMNGDNRFKVLQLTDLHLGEVGMGHLDQETLHMIRSLVDKEQPDFVAITGDLVSGQAWDVQTPRFWERHYAMIAETLSLLQVPWGMVPGYHDFEADANQEQMLQLEGQHKFAVALPNFYEHYGTAMHHQFTYEVPIENAINVSKTDARLWFFGTGRHDCMGSGGNDCIRRDQIEWFKDKSDKIPQDDIKRKNGIAFMHHALQEHMHLVNHYPVHGQKRDMSGCQALNTGIFAEMKQKGTVQWVSAGGDHSSDYWGTYSGINLGFGRKTGFSSYGPKFTQRGARVFEMFIDQTTGEMTTETWIRQQDGTIDDQREQSQPSLLSWLKSDHCQHSEELAHRGFTDSGWVPNFS